VKTRAATIVCLVAAALATLHPAGASHHGSHVVVPPGQPPPRLGPSYLYPDPETTPGVTNPQVTQANIQQTICVRGWTGAIRPPQSYTGTLKAQQLQTARFTDKNPPTMRRITSSRLNSAVIPVMRRTCGPRCGEGQGVR
jgi:hypothetical protein